MDFIYIAVYIAIAFFVIDYFTIKSNVYKFLTVVATTGILTAVLVYLFRNVFTNITFFSKFYKQVGYSACVYDIVLIIFIYYLYVFLQDKL